VIDYGEVYQLLKSKNKCVNLVEVKRNQVPEVLKVDNKITILKLSIMCKGGKSKGKGKGK
jgi:hypothetical protein